MSVPVRFDQLLPPRQAKIRQNLQTLTSKGASDDEIESYLRDDEHLTPPGQKTMLDVRPDVSSALPPNRENPSGDAGPLLRGTAANVLSAAQAIPGMEAVEAGAGARFGLPGGLSYQQSLNALRGETNAIPAPIKMAGQALFAAPLAARLLPAGASPAKVGAGLGAADQALAADPIHSMNDLETRAGRTAAGAAIGGTVGKVLDLGATMNRVRKAPNTSEELLNRIDARKAASNAAFPAAIAEGADKATPEEIQQFLQERDIAPIVSRLQNTRQFRDIAPSDPRFLDQIYKEMSDVGVRAGKAVESAGANVNSAGLTKGEIGLGKQQLLGAMETQTPQNVTDAMEGTGEQFMPSYRSAVTADAQRRAEETALVRGKMASKLSGRIQTPSTAQDKTITPQAMGRSYGPASGASDAQREAALQGIYSNTQGAIGRSGGRIIKRLLLHQANPISGANQLEKALNPTVTEDLIRLLGVGNAPVANP